MHLRPPACRVSPQRKASPTDGQGTAHAAMNTRQLSHTVTPVQVLGVPVYFRRSANRGLGPAVF